jgi:hypothetical protein
VAALLVSVGAGTRTNAAAKELTIATLLANELREWTTKLPYSDPDAGDAGNPPGPDGTDPQVFIDDLDDLLSVTYSPPRNGQGSAMNDMIGWSQSITCTYRDPANLAAEVSPGPTDIMRVSVTISYQSVPVLTTSWLVTRRE